MKRGSGLTAIVLGGTAFALAVSPWTLRGSARRAAVGIEMGHSIGLDVAIGGPLSLKLLPRPRLQVTDVKVRSRDGSVELTVPTLSGDLDIGALLKGRWRLASANLSSPTATIDMDAASTFVAGGNANGGNRDAFNFTVKSGVFRLVSRHLAADTLLTDVSARISGGSSRLSVTGSAMWRSTRGQFTAQLGAPRGVAADRVASAFLQASSPVASISASGDLVGEAQPRFVGRVSAASAMPMRLFSILGFGPSSLKLERASLSGDALIKVGDVALSGALLRVNGSAFEGTLGFHTDKGRSSIEGTLAAERLDLAGLLGRSIDRASLTELYGTRLAPHVADMDLDLRMSVGKVVLGSVDAKDVALSVLSRDRRIEATLDEAQMFDGVIKARFVAAMRPNGLEAHADLAVSNLELGPIGMALTSRERMTGTLTGKVAVDGRGERLRDIVPTLAGDGDLAVENGNVVGVSISQALKRFTRRLPFGVDQPGQVTAFGTASSHMQIAKGLVTFIDGKLAGPGIAMAFGGHGDLPRGKVDIVAVASQTDATGALIANAPRLPIEMRATWGQPLTLVQAAHHLALPSLVLPDIVPSPFEP